MQSRLKNIRHLIENKKGQKAQLQTTIDKLAQKIKEDGREARLHEKALIIVKEVGLSMQKQLEYHLAEQVSMAMDAVFDDPYQLKLNFQEKRGKTEVEILFARRDMEFPPIGSAGGGAIDVACFALRIAYWSMRQDMKVRPLLLLDEPFSQLKGEDANRRALIILNELAHKINLQIISVSDERVPREDIISNADTVYKVSQNSKGISNIEKIKFKKT
jgi:DNA repair exonuclease SbcCD ATPase subunit